MLEGRHDDPKVIAEICRRYGISEAEFHEWRQAAREGAAEAFGRREPVAVR